MDVILRLTDSSPNDACLCYLCLWLCACACASVLLHVWYSQLNDLQAELAGADNVLCSVPMCLYIFRRFKSSCIFESITYLPQTRTSSITCIDLFVFVSQSVNQSISQSVSLSVFLSFYMRAFLCLCAYVSASDGSGAKCENLTATHLGHRGDRRSEHEAHRI